MVASDKYEKNKIEFSPSLLVKVGKVSHYYENSYFPNKIWQWQTLFIDFNNLLTAALDPNQILSRPRSLNYYRFIRYHDLEFALKRMYYDLGIRNIQQADLGNLTQDINVDIDGEIISLRVKLIQGKTSIDNGSTKIFATLSLACIIYEGVANYPSFKDGWSEIERDFEKFYWLIFEHFDEYRSRHPSDLPLPVPEISVIFRNPDEIEEELRRKIIERKKEE